MARSLGEKTKNNPYAISRKQAGMRSRNEASERLGVMTPFTIERIERDLRQPTPEEIVIMADGYDAQHLLYLACSNCPIGKRIHTPIQDIPLWKGVVQIMNQLEFFRDAAKKLLILVEEDELSDLETFQHCICVLLQIVGCISSVVYKARELNYIPILEETA